MNQQTIKEVALFLLTAALLGCEPVTESEVSGALTPESRVATASNDANASKGDSYIAARGGGHFTVPPDLFGAEVGNVLTFKAAKDDGVVSGRFDYQQTFMGDRFHFNGPVTCFNVYDGNRAKIGGLIQVSNDPTLPPGVFIWWSVIDNGQGSASSADESTIIGAGDEAANEAFCNSAALPLFGPWELSGGNFQVDG